MITWKQGLLRTEIKEGKEVKRFPNQDNGKGVQGFSPGQRNTPSAPNALTVQLVLKNVIINDLTAKLNQ